MRQNTLRVEPVDNHHPAWGAVLAAIFKTGNRQSLMLHEDGWLSSRQTILAAFDEDQVVGHLCFRIEPVRKAIGTPQLTSRVDSFAVDESYYGSDVDEMLQEVAEYQAKLMRCQPPSVAMPA
jgi:hypothetical protein